MTTNKIEQYSAIETKIRSIGSELDGKVYDITTTKGLTAAKADRAIWRKLRTGVEAIRKETKADVLDLGRAIDAESKRLTGIIVDGGAHVESVVKAEDDRKAKEKQAREDAENRRVKAIQDMISGIRECPINAVGKDSTWIADLISGMESTELTEEFSEFRAQAEDVKADVLAKLREMYTAKVEEEKQSARFAAEKAEAERVAKIQEDVQKDKELKLAKERAEFEAEKAEKEKADREQEAAERKEQMESAVRAEIEETKILNMEGSLRYILDTCNNASLNDIQKVHKIKCATVAQVEKMEA